VGRVAGIPWKLVGLALIVVVGCGLFLPVFQSIHWVGSTDLEIEFVVTDAKDGRKLDGTTVSIRAEEGGFCWERDAKAFALRTQADGTAKHLCKACMCFGTKGWNRDTFAVHLPYWWFQASAPGYLSSEWEYLDDIGTMKYARQVRRGNGLAYLTVRIELVKVQAEPEAPADRPRD
jgi:hypothetical protein